MSMPSVGTRAGAESVLLAAGAHRLEVFAQHRHAEHQDALTHGQPPVCHKITISYKGEKETYDSYCPTQRSQTFGKQRLVITHRQADLSESAICLISHKLNWQAPGITRIRRHRGPVEVYPEEGKAEGLDQYQVRDFTARSRHIALGAVTYSLLRAAPTPPPSFTNFHVRSRRSLMARQARVSAPLRRRPSGPWRPASRPRWPRGRRSAR